jgi:hypothetical protein
MALAVVTAVFGAGCGEQRARTGTSHEASAPVMPCPG